MPAISSGSFTPAGVAKGTTAMGDAPSMPWVISMVSTASAPRLPASRAANNNQRIISFICMPQLLLGSNSNWNSRNASNRCGSEGTGNGAA